ncbi:MAG: hypothetical protein GY769_16155 [bacterium]|nr:hypothetical protein [bacterium]
MTPSVPRLLSLILCAGLAAASLSAQCDAPIDLGRGPIAFEVPSSYDPATPAPLVITLHGRGADGASQESYFRFAEFAEELGFLYAYPDGDIDVQGARFWNGTDACCDFFDSGIDHSSYVRELIETVRRQCSVDPFRIYFVGHSNGGFMAYRMACDHAKVVAGIASLAGATFFDMEDCAPSDPVHVLHIHGTLDTIIRYAGGLNGASLYPGAVRSAETWAAYNQCSPESETVPERLNLDTQVIGNETVVQRWGRDCRPGGSAELWTIGGGGHVPGITRDFRYGVVEHLLSHPACRRKERLKRPRCSAAGTLKLKLRKGVPGDSYGLRLSTGETLEGMLSASGKATLRIRKLSPGSATATVTWGCGASTSRSYTCP